MQNLYALFEKDPAEATRLQIRATLAISIIAFIRSRPESQAAFAKRGQITQPRISDLMCGKLEKFSIDGLLVLASRIGMTVGVAMNSERECSVSVKPTNGT